MDVIEINKDNREEYDAVVNHPLQSYAWGEFREKTGVKVIRRGFLKNGTLVDGFSVTIHKIPKTPFTIGYLPKGNLPSINVLEELKRIGRINNFIFIQLEPNILKNSNLKLKTSNLQPSFHPLFTKFTFILNISKSEEELLKSFHSKTRYNIRVATKHNVEVMERNSKEAFDEYLRLTKETTMRQKFFAHTFSYHTKMWETLKTKSKEQKTKNDNLSAHLLTATYKPDGEKEETLVSWILFVFHNYLYYPYGASSTKYRNVMASNLIMWEAIKFGKKLGLEYFDMWGALGPEPDTKDPWYGFHKFKEGYGATLTEFVGSYDLVINPTLYQFYKLADRARWAFLKIKKSL
jgi:lipid II:glycine glycyltransferase (peptidoglycan interpeptide bridge formation enzyme)